MNRRTLLKLPLSLLSLYGAAGPVRAAAPAPHPLPPPAMRKRWLFFWRDMTRPAEVDRMIARFGRAQADGYNGIVFSHNVAPEKAAELRAAAKRHGLDLVVLVMDGSSDHNYAEGLAAKDVLFVARGGTATHAVENPVTLAGGDFEAASGDKFAGWSYQDDIGVTTFADRAVAHGGTASLRIENVGKNDARHARLIQPLTLQPYRQYRVSFWLKTENLHPADPEVKILAEGTGHDISFQTIHAAPTQDWTHYDIVFNSREFTKANFYLGSWYGKDGKMWWDDLKIEETALVNVLRRPGCPVTVRGENGMVYEEGRDYVRIVDPHLQPYIPYHDPLPITLTANTRVAEGERLRVTYYHSILVYEDRVTSCLSEPKIFDDWRAEVKRVNELLHPAAFFMSHDELRVINQCALCRSKNQTPGELLAANVRKATQIIRDIRPDAEIWVWSDMFDPLHNAVDHFFAAHGTLAGSWKGLDRDVGIVNWNGGQKGKNCAFFANLGLKQILSGYYDGDEIGAGIAEWVASAKAVPGIDGAMYTTWEDRYDAMDAWAQKAWGKPGNTGAGQK